MRTYLHDAEGDKRPTVLAGQRLGITEVDDGVWLVSFMHYDLGYIDREQRALQNHRQPVRHEVVTQVLGTSCYLSLRAGHWKGW